MSEVNYEKEYEELAIKWADLLIELNKSEKYKEKVEENKTKGIEQQRISSVQTDIVLKLQMVRGMGTPEEPMRTVTQYWDMEGEFLVELDPRKKHTDVKG